MKIEQVERLLDEWAMKMGHHFRQRDFDTLVDLIAEATEGELEDLRSELTPVNDCWDESEY